MQGRLARLWSVFEAEFLVFRRFLGASSVFLIKNVPVFFMDLCKNRQFLEIPAVSEEFL